MVRETLRGIKSFVLITPTEEVHGQKKLIWLSLWHSNVGMSGHALKFLVLLLLKLFFAFLILPGMFSQARTKPSDLDILLWQNPVPSHINIAHWGGSSFTSFGLPKGQQVGRDRWSPQLSNGNSLHDGPFNIAPPSISSCELRLWMLTETMNFLHAKWT